MRPGVFPPHISFCKSEIEGEDIYISFHLKSSVKFSRPGKDQEQGIVPKHGITLNIRYILAINTGVPCIVFS